MPIVTMNGVSAPQYGTIPVVTKNPGKVTFENGPAQISFTLVEWLNAVADVDEQIEGKRERPDTRVIRFWEADLETKHFHFMAFGETKEAAAQAMREAMIKHAEAYDIVEETFVREFFDSVEFHERLIGAGYRDNEMISQRILT